jgi:hypothetical protein
MHKLSFVMVVLCCSSALSQDWTKKTGSFEKDSHAFAKTLLRNPAGGIVDPHTDIGRHPGGNQGLAIADAESGDSETGDAWAEAISDVYSDVPTVWRDDTFWHKPVTIVGWTVTVGANTAGWKGYGQTFGDGEITQTWIAGRDGIAHGVIGFQGSEEGNPDNFHYFMRVDAGRSWIQLEWNGTSWDKSGEVYRFPLAPITISGTLSAAALKEDGYEVWFKDYVEELDEFQTTTEINTSGLEALNNMDKESSGTGTTITRDYQAYSELGVYLMDPPPPPW